MGNFLHYILVFTALIGCQQQSQTKILLLEPPWETVHSGWDIQEGNHLDISFWDDSSSLSDTAFWSDLGYEDQGQLDDQWMSRDFFARDLLDDLFFEEIQEDTLPPAPWFMVAVLDVGQGDSIFLRFPEGTTMLVDGGRNGKGKGVIVPYLRGQGVDRLDVMVLTHPDADHCGGLDEVAREVDVALLWENGLTSGTATYRDFSETIDQLGIPRQVVRRGYSEILDGCEVGVLNADEGWNDSNGNSIVMQIQCEGATVLLTGDAHSGTQNDLIKEYGAALSSDIAQVPHHGSANRDPAFPSVVSPHVAFCSVGQNNSYGHPAQVVVDEWEAAGASFFRTDIHGTVEIRVSDSVIEVSTAR